MKVVLAVIHRQVVGMFNWRRLFKAGGLSVKDRPLS